MAVLNVAVILWAWHDPAETLSLRDKSWYEEYFFSPLHGQAAYWAKQSDHTANVVGHVFDWVFDPDQNRDFSNRNETLKMAVRLFEERDVDFKRYNCIIVVLGVPKSKYANVDGGTGSVKIEAGWRRGIVTRLDDAFDFMTHELGHALGLEHSFTWDQAVQYIGEGPGGYGHKHCIMSAMVYGGNEAEAHHDGPMAPLEAEYRDIGPSVNGVTAYRRAWIDAHEVALQPTFSAEFELRSRQWGGRDPTQPPQAIHITKPDGADYIVDFYESLDWDAGLKHPRLILTQGHGGLAEANYPGKGCGTFLDSKPVPVGGLDTSLKPPPGTYLTASALHYDPLRHVIKVRVSGQPHGGQPISFNTSEETVSTPTGHRDEVTFAPDERFCVEGTFTAEEYLHRTTARIKVTHPLAQYGGQWTWKVEGVALTQATGTLKVPKTVFVAEPKKTDLTAPKVVTLKYRIDALPGGSRLQIENQPEDETFQIVVETGLTTSVGSGSGMTEIKFQGREFVFGDDYWAAYSHCVSAFLKRKVKDAQVLVTFNPKQQIKFTPNDHKEVVGWLNGLTSLLAAGEYKQFEAASSILRRTLMTPDLKLVRIDTTDLIQVAVPDTPLAPPASARLPFFRGKG